MSSNVQGLLHVIEFEKQKMEQMQNIITKVEDLRDNFRSHHALEENAYQRACDDVVELLQLLQQTPCTTLLEDLEQKLKAVRMLTFAMDEVTAARYDATESTLLSVIELIKERQPIA